MPACLHLFDARVVLLPAISEDTNYAEVYRRATRTSRVYHNLDHQFSVRATHLSQDFLSAFRIRHRFLTTGDQDMFANQPQTAFMVSLESPLSADLRDYLTWTVHLQQGDTRHDPLVIKRINNKPKLELFFQNVTPWSQEYLLVFASQEDTPISPIQLVLGNSRAKVQLSWKN